VNPKETDVLKDQKDARGFPVRRNKHFVTYFDDDDDDYGTQQFFVFIKTIKTSSHSTDLFLHDPFYHFTSTHTWLSH